MDIERRKKASQDHWLQRLHRLSECDRRAKWKWRPAQKTVPHAAQSIMSFGINAAPSPRKSADSDSRRLDSDRNSHNAPQQPMSGRAALLAAVSWGYGSRSVWNRTIEALQPGAFRWRPRCTEVQVAQHRLLTRPDDSRQVGQLDGAQRRHPDAEVDEAPGRIAIRLKCRQQPGRMCVRREQPHHGQRVDALIDGARLAVGEQTRALGNSGKRASHCQEPHTIEVARTHASTEAYRREAGCA